jgi:hypothetical protein
MEFEQGRLELSFQEERETTEDLEKRLQGLREQRFPLSVKATTLIGGGVVKPGVGKYSEVLGLNQVQLQGREE